MKKILIPVYAACAAVVLAAPAFAYVDPSVTTAMLSAIVAAVVAVGATVGVLVRKAKKKAQQVLNIDENANRIVEDEIVVNAAAVPAEEKTEETAKAE